MIYNSLERLQFYALVRLEGPLKLVMIHCKLFCFHLYTLMNCSLSNVIVRKDTRLLVFRLDCFACLTTRFKIFLKVKKKR